MPPKRVAVVGGSLAGLSAAVVLEGEGMEVTVLERRADSEQQVGGGIIAQPAVCELLDEVCPSNSSRVKLAGRQFLDESGRPSSIVDAPQEAGSWWSLRKPLRAAFGGRFFEGVSVTGLEPLESGIKLEGEGVNDELGFDFVVVADGGGGRLRESLLGDDLRPPEYAGYVAWRGVVPQEDLDEDQRALLLGERASFFHGDKTHILFYPIPTPDGVALNWVWYWNVPERELRSLLKDERLGRQGAFSVPPGMLGDAARGELLRLAAAELPEALRRAVEGTRQPFLQPVVDFRAPRLLFHGGRVALLGDAGCVLRPHTTYGTAKAVEEARGLSRALAEGAESLRAWEAASLARSEGLSSYGAFLGKSQEDKDARDKLRYLQGGKLDSSSAARQTMITHAGA